MKTLVIGMKVRYAPQAEWGVGHLVQLAEGGSKALVFFPTRPEPVWVSTKQGALVSHAFRAGDEIETVKGKRAVITSEEEGGRGLRRYALRYDDGTDDELPESELRAVAPKPDAIAMLREGRVADAKAFALRRRALLLDEERRCDALGALLASRVMVKPHQVGVVQRVLSAPRPRFVLADEVGLGKTIEAGMVFSALRLSGLARRVLVVAPSHLTVQWLAELFHKFNQLFTLLDADRYAQSKKEEPDRSPWARFDKVVASLEMLSRTEEHLAEASAPNAYWDLVIIDEAHHLKGQRAFEVASGLAKNAWGLLLLTATPMQLDPAEYHGLLRLIDPDTAPTLEGLKARLARQDELSLLVRSVLEGKRVGDAHASLCKRFPGDKKLATLKEPEPLLQHVAETYSLSDRLIRNRRVVVGGFSERRLHRHPVQVPKAELDARASAVELLRTKGSLRGATLSSLLRRLESSPPAFFEALAGQKALGELGADMKLPRRDAKLLAFLGVLKEIWGAEPNAKVLVFTEARATLEWLREELRHERIEALVYHGDLPLLDRDRQVARFRDPEGPKILLCTEVGGEGRNFQFAHHLVHYDLPWSPATVEQRIGRLDRIGQTKPVDIHVFEAPGTFAADVLAVLADSVGVFGETVGGLDAVLEEVEPKLGELALLSPDERARYAQELKTKVTQAREQVRRAYDPLLDMRSFDRPQVEALVQRAQERIGVESEDDSSLEDGLWSVARDLDERLEETVGELAQRVGIGVDTDQQVEAFQCAFHFGHELKVEALPGVSLDERVVLGTFWRDTAVEQEEIEYFATGHPIVEALFGFLRDGPYGRNGMRYYEKRGLPRVRGLEFLFHIVPPEPEDTSPGARVPSRQLSRFLDRWLVQVAVKADAQGPKVDASVLPLLEGEGRAVRGDEVRAAFPELPEFVDGALAAATRAAEVEMRQRAARAKAAIERERDDTLGRMALALEHQGVAAEQRDAAIANEREHYEHLLAALGGLKLSLDSAGAFAINR